MADSSEKKAKQGFFHNLSIEFKKIIWPNKKTMFRQSVAVVIISVIAGLIIAIVDACAKYGVNFLISL